MRISTERYDSGLPKYEEVLAVHAKGECGRIKVLLDGVELKHVLTADEELGEVLVTEEDGPNKLKLAPDGESLLKTWRYGTVEIRVEGWER